MGSVLLAAGGLLALFSWAGLLGELLDAVAEAVAVPAGAIRADQRSEAGQLEATAALPVPADPAEELDECPLVG